ncbi:MAG: DUF1874 domain-containing protein, partial [Candidatus Aenigmatarchaeota archaeon]
NETGLFRYRKVQLEEARQIVSKGFKSIVGHAATAELLAKLLNIEVNVNRVQIKAVPGDQILVCQLLVRLEEGRILTLEEMEVMYQEGKIVFILVEILS